MLLVPLSQASILVTVPDTEATVSGLEKSFRIGLINTGEEANLTLETRSGTGINIETPGNLTLDRGEAVKNPRGSNWYYSGEEYYPIRYIQVNTSIPIDTDIRTHEFDLIITREYKTDLSRPNVEEVRELNFQLYTRSDQIQTGFTSQPDEKKDVEEKEDGNTSSKPEIIIEETPGTRNTSNSPEGEESAGSSSLTIFLVLGTVISVLWLLREVFT